MDNEISFYEPEDEFGFLSNFSLSPLFIDGVTWSTVEHYYQSQKFHHFQLRQIIREAPTPAKAFSLSRVFQPYVRHDWEDVRCSVMRFAVQEKFRQHPDLSSMLLATGSKHLCEHSHNDSFWGDGGTGEGQNELGKILMEVRSML